MTTEHHIEYEPYPGGGMIETAESFDRRIAERYRPHSDKPWRVTWGFGCHEDFATVEEARPFYAELPANRLPEEPFNAVEVWSKS